MKRQTVLSIAPSTVRRLANYVLEYTKVERDNGYDKGSRAVLLHRLEGAAKQILADTSKRRLISEPDKDLPDFYVNDVTQNGG